MLIKYLRLLVLMSSEKAGENEFEEIKEGFLESFTNFINAFSEEKYSREKIELWIKSGTIRANDEIKNDSFSIKLKGG